MRDLLLIVAAVFLCPMTGAAQTPEPFPTARFAFFNGERVATESTIGQAAMAELEAFRANTTAEIEQRTRAIQAEHDRLQRSATVLSAQARLEMQRSVQTIELDLQRFIEDMQTQFLSLQRQADREFQLSLAPVVQQIAGDRGVHFVFDQSAGALFWANERFDLTAAIIEQLDDAAAND